MRKYLFAAAAAGGLLLLGAAPAHADDRPAPGLLGGLLDPAGGILPADGLNVDSPVGDAPLVDVDPGDNTPSVVPTLPAHGTTPAARTGLGSVEPDRKRPAAKTEDDDRPARPAARPRPTDVLPVANLLGGLLPDGRASAATADARESGLLDGDLPLLGGLGGLLPEPARTLPADADDPDVSGMPVGGSDVPAASPGTAPATSAPPATGDDDEAGGRSFSEGRPVAGPDPDFR